MIQSPCAARPLATGSYGRTRIRYNTDRGMSDSDAARIWAARRKQSPVGIL
jgi:hypothetical protein